MDQIKFVTTGGRNGHSESVDKMQQKSSSTHNIFKSNALKNLSKNMGTGTPIVKESKEDSFGDYNDPLDKEAREFISSQLDVRLSTKSKDEMIKNTIKHIPADSEEHKLTNRIAKSYPFVMAKYEKASTAKKQQMVKMINEIDCELAGVFGQDSATFEDSLTDINNDRKLQQIDELFN